MIRIGLISDTHGYMDDRILDYFKNCGEIWHAGDIGTIAVSEKLSELGRFRAVHGNIDDSILRSKYPESQIFSAEGMKIWITHIGGLPPKYNRKIISGIQEYDPDLFICGHSHIARVIPDRERNLIYLNPGAAGQQGFHKTRTIMRFSIDEDKIRDLQVIELGKRGIQQSQ